MFSTAEYHEQTVAHHTIKAQAEAVVCPHCTKPVHPSNHDAHMERYHSEVTMKPTLKIDLTGSALTKDEAQRYTQRNAEIKAAMASLVIMAEALADVRDNRLYREHYPSFEAYCRGEWDKSRAWGNARVSASYIIDLLATFVDSDDLPVRESQTRALAAIQAATPGDAPVSEDFLARAWKLALNTTPNHDPDEVTEAHIKRVGKVINEAITTGGYVDPGTGTSEPVTPASFHAAVLIDQVESLSRQWEHMTRKRAKLYSGAVNRARVVDDQFSRLIEVSLPLDTNLDELRAAIASGKPITVTLTTPKEDAS